MSKIGRCRKGVDHGSDEPPKLVPIDEQSNHEIVHALRLGKTNRATHQPFDPRAQVDVLTLDFLRVFLPHVMGLCIEMPLIGPPPVGVELRNPKRRQ